MKRNLLTPILILIFCHITYAQFGILDPTFGTGTPAGTSIFTNPGSGGFEKAIAFQTDGKILVSTGGSSLALGRLNTNGTPDVTFGNNGWVSVGNYAIGDIVVQPDGKILVTGKPTTISFQDFYIWRFNASGTPDNSFGTNGMRADSTLGGAGEHIALQADGKIIWSGYSGFTRLESNGTRDMSFGTNGYLRTNQLPISIWAIALDPLTGSVIASGYTKKKNSIAVIRVTSAGNLDPAFGNNGVDSINAVYNGLDVNQNIRLTKSGKIAMASNYSSGNQDHILCAQFNSNGTADNSFGANGIVFTTWGATKYEFLGGIDVQPDNKIVIACGATDTTMLANGNDIIVQRLNTNGTTDAIFGMTHLDVNHASEYPEAVGIEPGGKLLVNGSTGSSELIARYTTGVAGLNNGSAQAQPVLIYPNPAAGFVKIDLGTALNVNTVLSITNVTGEVLQTQMMNEQDSEKLIDISSLVNGVYFITLNNSQQQTRMRLVVMH